MKKENSSSNAKSKKMKTVKAKKAAKNEKEYNHIKKNKKKKLQVKPNDESEVYESSDGEDLNNSVLQREVDDFFKIHCTASTSKSVKQKTTDEKSKKLNQIVNKASKKRKMDDNLITDFNANSKNRKNKVETLATANKRKCNDINSSTTSLHQDTERRNSKKELAHKVSKDIPKSVNKSVNKISKKRKMDNLKAIEANSQPKHNEKFDILELKAVLNSEKPSTSLHQDTEARNSRKETKLAHKVSKDIPKSVNKSMNKISKKRKMDNLITDSSDNLKAIKANSQPKHNEKFDILELKAVLNSEKPSTSLHQDTEARNSRKELTHKGTKAVQKLVGKNKLTTTEEHVERTTSTSLNTGDPMAAEENAVLSKKGSDLPCDKDLFREKLMKQLQSASFRILNEQMYTSTGSDSYRRFHEDPDTFKIYHEGYSNQVENWPVNPLKAIASWLRKKPPNWVVADFGCGDATLAKSIKQKVFSLDLVALSPGVIECDMAHTPLESESVNVAVFCLSLMGTNLTEFIVEANRVLVSRGVLKIAEVESRFSKIEGFLKVMSKLGFQCIKKNQKENYFWMFDFLKIKEVRLKPNNPQINLAPCMYKKR